MPETSTLTIVFRGLLMFHHNQGAGRMDIGLVRAPGHFPRIVTIKNGVLYSVNVINQTDLNNPKYPTWDLVADNPASQGASVYTNGTFERMKGGNDERDFRWIMDLEGDEFYRCDLSRQVRTRDLWQIIRVPQGEFYTHLKSPFLRRQEDNGKPADFGPVAAVVGCAIRINGGGAALRTPDGQTIFNFENQQNTIYELTNTPPDVRPGAGGGGEHDHDPAARTVRDDHFHHYYSLFPPGFRPRYSFHLDDDDKDFAPDPALCGSVSFGRRTGPLGQDESN